MSNNDPVLKYALCDITAAVAADPAEFVNKSEARFDAQIAAAADRLADRVHGRLPVWLCGPSCVGKTTTSHRLCAALENKGIAAFTVSLDDFYRAVADMPGVDPESPEALRLDKLRDTVTALCRDGVADIPRFDFHAKAPTPVETTLHIHGDAVIFLEGVHAFSPLLTTALDTVKLYINTGSRFADGEHILLHRRDIRLARRLLRDERMRNSTFADTLTRWPQVLAGAQTYIFPYVDDADIVINSTIAYEPCISGPLLSERLSTLDGTPFADCADSLRRAFSRFPSLPLSLVPDNSVLREFIG